MYSARRRSAKRGTAGLSLIEALMATSVLSIGLMGLSASSILLSRSAKRADMTSAAVSLATERIELLRSMPLGSSNHLAGTYSGGSLNANGSNGGPYAMSWVVSAKNTPTFGLKTVTVTSTWSQWGQSRNVQVAALVRCTATPCTAAE